MQLRAGMTALSPSGRLMLRRSSAGAIGAGRRALLATKSAGDGTGFEMPFKSLMAANRGEIAVRIMRAGNELGLRTVGIFSKEDRFTQHRYVRLGVLVMRGASVVASVCRRVCLECRHR